MREFKSHQEKLELAQALVTRMRNKEITPTLFEYDLRRLGFDQDAVRDFKTLVGADPVYGRTGCDAHVRHRDVVSDVAREQMDRAWLQAYYLSHPRSKR